MLTILSSASARPNFVKLAAVHHAIAAREDMRHLIVHTGQHYDPLFSDVFFQELNIPAPTRNLGIKGGFDRETVIDLTACAMTSVLEELQPDIVLVYGDVNGAVGAARAARTIGITLGHVEAGLRSFDTSMPEELNRIEIDQLSDVLFVSEESGMRNMKNEQLRGTAHLVGNTMIDTLVRMQPAIDRAAVPPHLPRRFAIATLHRPSNVDRPEDLERNLRFIAEVSTRCPVVLPLHRRTQQNIRRFDLSACLVPSVTVIDPLGYIEFLALIKRASFILTDSGGMQEEATFLRKKCFTLRLNTERPSTIESGSNTLIDLTKGTDRTTVLDFAAASGDPAVIVPPLWDGKAGERILAALSC
ncbi:MAG: UDP-N-acetylglucosamine 2-epimerase (non-hydrolyzing) [Candidatus Peribacteraceae bacterium]|nr:UDP-N-acetylglucosamine 2-epimerase (non-hydrolyzing) [Candidatus Peribacteraceae bacterium]